MDLIIGNIVPIVSVIVILIGSILFLVGKTKKENILFLFNFLENLISNEKHWNITSLQKQNNVVAKIHQQLEEHPDLKTSKIISKYINKAEGVEKVVNKAYNVRKALKKATSFIPVMKIIKSFGGLF